MCSNPKFNPRRIKFWMLRVQVLLALKNYVFFHINHKASVGDKDIECDTQERENSADQSSHAPESHKEQVHQADKHLSG